MRCEEKKIFKSKKEAISAAAYTFTHYGTLTREYKCKQCGKYHLATQRPHFLRDFPAPYFKILETYLQCEIPELNDI